MKSMDTARKSYIMDMDGVIYSENVLIEGAKDFIETLIKRGNKFLFTNWIFTKKRRENFIHWSSTANRTNLSINRKRE